MKLGQVRQGSRLNAAIFEGTRARVIPDYTLYELICRAEKENAPLGALAAGLVSSHREEIPPVIPLRPAEVWACGCTYEMSASFRDAEHGTREGFYAHVHRADRPEIFFKGTSRVCVGNNKPIGIRPDSKFTAPEPELAVVLGVDGKVLGYTLANDVSAWDIERENPLYLPQSKVYTACCALGPVIVTPDELPDPYSLAMTCTIEREGKVIFAETVSTAKLGRKIPDLIRYLLRSNPVPAGSVLLTGTGIIVRQDCALAPGDVVAISVPEIGELRNTAAMV
ncbi:MAG: fumarylacetoacetate hydrolase family protein [Acidobacteria bacterium]|nr:fumarylacetoacetate hydrolase family protein [Acidobacteriota bacterium]